MEIGKANNGRKGARDFSLVDQQRAFCLLGAARASWHEVVTVRIGLGGIARLVFAVIDGHGDGVTADIGLLEVAAGAS